MSDSPVNTTVDKKKLIAVIVFFVALGLTVWVCFGNLWPYTKILSMMTDSQGYYYPKMVAGATFFCIYLPLFLVQFVVTKLVKK